MRRRIAALAFILAAIYGGFFILIYQAFDNRDWPEW